MTAEEVREIRARYFYLVSAEGDIDGPVDPLAYVDSNGDHLLHIAARRGDLRTAKLLLNAGEDVNVRGDMGCTALHNALMKGEEAMAQFLLLNGADGSIIDAFGRLADDWRRGS
jgi:ankyrin repeat protein